MSLTIAEIDKHLDSNYVMLTKKERSAYMRSLSLVGIIFGGTVAALAWGGAKAAIQTGVSAQAIAEIERLKTQAEVDAKAIHDLFVKLQSGEAIQTHQLKIVDEHGNVRATFGPAAGNATQLQIKDEFDRMVCEMHVKPGTAEKRGAGAIAVHFDEKTLIHMNTDQLGWGGPIPSLHIRNPGDKPNDPQKFQRLDITGLKSK